MSDWKIHTRAYAKIVLHACKFMHTCVNGVLLGEKGQSRYIVDAVPLFHATLTISPMLEAALYQIDSFCKARGLRILGYYQANEHISDNQPNHIAMKIADKVADQANSPCCMIMLNNESLNRDCDTSCLNLFTNQNNHWKEADTFDVEDTTLKHTSFLLFNRMTHSLIDFDNHLDDISLSWSNYVINEKVDSLQTSASGSQ